jgi:hypothetical protein
MCARGWSEMKDIRVSMPLSLVFVPINNTQCMVSVEWLSVQIHGRESLYVNLIFHLAFAEHNMNMSSCTPGKFLICCSVSFSRVYEDLVLMVKFKLNNTICC